MSASDRIYTTVEGVKIALDSLRANKVRAALTIMGVAVGVFVVTGMAAAVHGIQSKFAEDMAAAVKLRPGSILPPSVSVQFAV